MVFKKEIAMNWYVKKSKKSNKEWDLEFEAIVELSKHSSSSGSVGIDIFVLTVYRVALDTN